MSRLKKGVDQYLPSKCDTVSHLSTNCGADAVKTRQALKEAIKIAQVMTDQKAAENPDATFGVALTDAEQNLACDQGMEKVGLRPSDTSKMVEDATKELSVEDVT